MEEPQAAAGADVSLHNFSARLWEQLVHFHVMRLTDSLFLWVGATPQLRNLAVAMCSRYDPIPVCTSLFGDTSDTTSSGLAQRLGGSGARRSQAVVEQERAGLRVALPLSSLTPPPTAGKSREGAESPPVACPQQALVTVWWLPQPYCQERRVRSPD
ncbi:proteasome assembly chaperone 4 isoform X1 [Peromyscus californicus insignis]|uniref:proteasome assembly chaperone 4 isoform X1 n=1 Tax=Peromyscus californicus insignis TaxID=564181 RepID=UPI0022A80271|nr:proteasome assembly chaperone 4 isoform X1 [Peromyscus californicus insignis]